MARASEIVDLDCEASMTSGARLVLQTRLAEMCALRDTALDWSDIKGVHDMRVASRRLRSALRDFAPYFRKRDLQPLRNSLKMVADALGAVRDEDVTITALEKLAASAPADVVAGIERLAAEHREGREKARVALVEAISEDRLAQIRAASDATLGQTAETSHAPATEPPQREELKAEAARHQRGGSVDFRQAGREIIARRLSELQHLSSSLYRPFEVNPLHELRIAAKRLRYALELLAQCWGETLVPYAKEVAELQTALGELHDCDVWIDNLGARLSHWQERRSNAQTSSEVSQGDYQAAMWLLSQFVSKRTKYYQEALERWHTWENDGFVAHLLDTLNSYQSPPTPKSGETLPAEFESSGVEESRQVF